MPFVIWCNLASHINRDCIIKNRHFSALTCFVSNCQSSDHLDKLSLGSESESAYYYVNPAKLPSTPITAVRLEQTCCLCSILSLHFLYVRELTVLSQWIQMLAYWIHRLFKLVLFYSTITSTHRFNLNYNLPFWLQNL